MSYPLVRDLAADGVPVSVTCRVLTLARQPYYRWLANPVTDAEWVQAHRANALFDAHRDDPEFGYRYLLDEARDAGVAMADRTAWRICSGNGWWSAFGKKRGRNGKRPGPPVHDDLCAVTDAKGRVRHQFKAQAANELWIGDITEHWTTEGKLYVCAFKDVWSNRIVGYSIDSRMKARLSPRWTTPSPDAASSPAAWFTPTGDRNFEAGNSSAPWAATAWSDRWAESAQPATTRPWRASSPCCRRTSSTAASGPPAKTSGSPS